MNGATDEYLFEKYFSFIRENFIYEHSKGYYWQRYYMDESEHLSDAIALRFKISKEDAIELVQNDILKRSIENEDFFGYHTTIIVMSERGMKLFKILEL